MPLDRFNTQVLLLHSERGTLDNLGAGFNDRYTVHYATSGTEALNTLGDTPIHVIVSAQELPGMSGVEALREAKKRSPETIGILLASIGDDLEALVGDEEVFQIVRGGISPKELRKLIDNATQQLRLMALAKSANDSSARVDHPASQHIVMETADNGSAIISDGTGRMRALDPTKISSAIAVGARTIDVVVLTTDEEFLSTIKDSARGLHNIHHANTLKEAEAALGRNKVGVAVVDAAIVGANIEKITQHLRASQDRLVAIVAGRRDDGEMLMDLINRGKVYRFLMKPVSTGRARLAIEASVKHHLEAPDSAFKAASKSRWTPNFASFGLQKNTQTPDPGEVAAQKRKAEAAAAKQRAAAAKQKADAAAAKNKAQTAARQIAEAAAAAAKQKNEAEAARLTAEAEAARLKAEAAAAKLKAEAAAAKLKADAAAAKLKAELAAEKQKAEALAKKQAEAEAKKKAEAAARAKAEAAATKKAEAAAKKQAKTEAAAIKQAKAEAKKQAKAAAKAEAAAKKKADAAARQQAKSSSHSVTAATIRPSLANDRLSGAFGAEEGGVKQQIGAIFRVVGRIIAGATQLLKREDAPRKRTAIRSSYASTINLRKVISVAAVVLIAVGSGGYWYLGDFDSVFSGLGSNNETDPMFGTSLMPGGEDGLTFDELLEMARDAREAGQIFNPPVANAIELYLAAESVAPSGASIDAELAATLDEALGMAETALLERRNDDAAAALAQVKLADPGHPRLPFLSVQLAEVQLRDYLVEARSAIRDAHFEDAATALARARSLDGADRTEIDALAAELKTTRSARRVDGTLALATQQFESGMLVSPANDNARYYFELVLSTDPNNLAARQGLKAIASKLILQAREQIDIGKFDAAEKLLSDVRSLDPSSSALAASKRALLEARESAPTSSRPSQVDRLAIAQGPSSTPRQAPARRPKPVVKSPEPKPDTTAAATTAGDDKTIAATTEGADIFAAAAETDSGSDVAQDLPPPAAEKPVAVSSLVRTKYVAPRYPRSAQRRKLSGWVDVVFTLTLDGTVTNVDVIESTPGSTFVDAAIRAVEGWEFEPVFNDGIAVEKRATVRMMFAIE